MIHFKAVLMVFILVTIFSSVVCCSQKNLPLLNHSSQKKYDKSVADLRRGHTYEAISILEDLLERYPDHPDILLSLGAGYVDIKETTRAIATLEKFISFSKEQNPLVYSSLGALYMDKKDFVVAHDYYNSSLALIKKDSKMYLEVLKMLEQLDFILASYAHPYPFHPVKLDGPVNTEVSEYLAQFSIDGQNLVFTRRLNGQEDLYEAIQFKEGWSVHGLDDINTSLNEGAHTLSSDGSLLIFTHCNDRFGYGSCDLYSSERTLKGWSLPKNLGSSINTASWESQPSLSSDNKTLYYSSSREGSLGGRDIWKSTKTIEGPWGPPINLGPVINTPRNEESPFIHADNHTLYFRSNGRLGIGGFDIYMSHLDSLSWSYPLHLGVPINGPENDGALVVSLDGMKGYYASDFFNGVKSDNLNIFEFNIPVIFRPEPMTYVKGRVIDELSRMPLRASVQLVNLTSGQLIASLTANNNGDFLVAIPVGTSVSFNVSYRNHLFYSDHISFDSVRYGVKPFNYDISLQPIHVPDSDSLLKEPVILKNVFFESGRAILLPESFNEIGVLFQMLNENRQIRILISGHTDNIGSEEDNLILSSSRASAVKKELINLGIDPLRIESKGMGESRPIGFNDTPGGRAINRRTEFVIISS